MPSKLRARLRSPRSWLALGAAGITAALAATGCTSLAEKERELVFRIERGTARWYDGIPAGLQEFDLPVPPRTLATATAARQSVHAWWWPSARKDAPAILYLHGSRWNLTGQLFRIRELHDLGFSVFAIDYRGFGKSEGEQPSEGAVYEDARIGWDAMAARVPDPHRRFIYGHSLGGAIAVDLASGLSMAAKKADAPVPAAGLVVESSFTTLADIARAFSYSWLPIQLVLTQKFDSVDKIVDVRMPVIVLHGDSDRYVPLGLGRRLYDAAPQPKRLIVVADGTHNNSLRLGERDMRRAFGDLFSIRIPSN
ncbi:MAG: alpha/beta fold hydrolase [Burkholderiaceae bacterium]